MKRTFKLFFVIIPLLLLGCATADIEFTTPPERPERARAQEKASAPVQGETVKGDTIRVEVMRGLERVKVDSGEGTVIISHLNGGRMDVDNERWYGPYRAEPAEDVVRANGKPFRGKLYILPSSNGLQVINELPIEYYLTGILNNEISTSWHPEVIKAQTVIARTYAIYHKEKRKEKEFHVSSTSIDQVYTGSEAEDSVAWRAVRETTGEVVTYKGELALTLYHSNAGGVTEAAKNVWGGDYDYLRSVKSPFDKGAPRYTWDYSINRKTLSSILVKSGHTIGKPTKARIKKKTSTGRVKLITFKDGRGNEATLSGEELRRTLGYDKLRSTKFRVEKKGGNFVFNGNGAGHGVGLSQWGAKGMADNGYSYGKILRHYYPGTRIKTLY